MAKYYIQSNNKIGKVTWVLFLFIGIFMPCLIKIRMQYIVFTIEVLYVVWQIIKSHTIVIDKQLFKVFLAFLPFYVYYTALIITKVFFDKINSEKYLIEYTQVLTIGGYVIVLSFVLVMFKRANYFSSDLFYKLFIAVGTIQLVCVILSFFFPSVKIFFNSLTLNNSFSEIMASWYTRQWYMSWRAYGLGENLFDGFGFVISIIISIVFIYGLSKRYKGIIVLGGVMLIMPLLNTRTGLVLCFVSLVIIFFCYMNSKRFLWYIAGISLITVLFFILYNKLPRGLQIALEAGLTDFKNLFRGEKTGIFSQLFSEDIVFPNDIIWGAGISPERLEEYVGIDSGYIQCIWRYGLIGTILLFFALVYSFRMAFRMSGQKQDQVLAFTTTVTIFIYSFKLFLFNSYADIFLVFTILFSIVLGRRKGEVSVMRIKRRT